MLTVSPVLADETPAPGGPAPAATAPAPAVSAPAAAPAPKPDPAGIATGDKSSVQDAGGNALSLLSPPIRKTLITRRRRRISTITRLRQPKEPLAVKLADAVGHNRIAGNFNWTLITGYLVLFMQAGFALLTCGLVRRKNAGHLMMLNLRGVRLRFPGVLCVRLRIPVWRGCCQCRTGDSRRRADSRSLPPRGRSVGLCGWQGLLPERPCVPRGKQLPHPV